MDAQEARIYIAIIITGFVLGTIIIYFTVSVIRQQRKNLELQKANALAEISAMEKERTRIAADLHDELGPVLSVIKFQVDHVEHVEAEEKLQLQKASRSLDELIARMREVANNLMPSALLRKGLFAAVSEFTSNAGAVSGISISFEANEEIKVSEDKSINIYRIIQEVVHNSIKHASATSLKIKMEEKSGMIKIFCRDNGKGFDYPLVFREGQGIGLRSIRNRTDIMGGNLVVESKLGKGTAYLIEIPVT